MGRYKLLKGLLPFCLVFFAVSALADDEPEEEVEVSLSGSASVELRLFPDDPPDPRQDYVGELSFALEPEWYWSWGDGHHSFLFKALLAHG